MNSIIIVEQKVKQQKIPLGRMINNYHRRHFDITEHKNISEYDILDSDTRFLAAALGPTKGFHSNSEVT